MCSLYVLDSCLCFVVDFLAVLLYAKNVRLIDQN